MTQSAVVRGYRVPTGDRGTDPAMSGVRRWRAPRMKTAYFSAALSILFLVPTGASAQDRQDQQFSEHDRQVTRDWYNQHQNNAPRGMRSEEHTSELQSLRQL